MINAVSFKLKMNGIFLFAKMSAHINFFKLMNQFYLRSYYTSQQVFFHILHFPNLSRRQLQKFWFLLKFQTSLVNIYLVSYICDSLFEFYHFVHLLLRLISVSSQQFTQINHKLEICWQCLKVSRNIFRSQKDIDNFKLVTLNNARKSLLIVGVSVGKCEHTITLSMVPYHPGYSCSDTDLLPIRGHLDQTETHSKS